MVPHTFLEVVSSLRYSDWTWLILSPLNTSPIGVVFSPLFLNCILEAPLVYQLSLAFLATIFYYLILRLYIICIGYNIDGLISNGVFMHIHL